MPFGQNKDIIDEIEDILRECADNEHLTNFQILHLRPEDLNVGQVIKDQLPTLQNLLKGLAACKKEKEAFKGSSRNMHMPKRLSVFAPNINLDEIKGTVQDVIDNIKDHSKLEDDDKHAKDKVDLAMEEVKDDVQALKDTDKLRNVILTIPPQFQKIDKAKKQNMLNDIQEIMQHILGAEITKPALLTSSMIDQADLTPEQKNELTKLRDVYIDLSDPNYSGSSNDKVAHVL